MKTISSTLSEIKELGIKKYLDKLFTRSYGTSINYTSEDHVVLTSQNVTFHMTKNGSDYYLTVQDIVYLIRYVRFLSNLVSFLIFLTIILIVFWS